MTPSNTIAASGSAALSLLSFGLLALYAYALLAAASVALKSGRFGGGWGGCA